MKRFTVKSYVIKNGIASFTGFAGEVYSVPLPEITLRSENMFLLPSGIDNTNVIGQDSIIEVIVSNEVICTFSAQSLPNSNPAVSTLAGIVDSFSNAYIGSKVERIRNSTSYSQVFTYVSGTNVGTIVHSATTDYGPEQFTETFTYVNPGANDYRVLSIIRS
jgi:hypothetical protein